jgi:methylenetetrahydromethanopterin dehydrogenase
MTVRVGIVKLGNLGTSRYIDLILDERADRDVFVRAVGTGAKLGEPEAVEAVTKILDFKPQFCIVISPNATIPGRPRRGASGSWHPDDRHSDVPVMKIRTTLRRRASATSSSKADSMIGARRRFLDPTEMVLFNAEMTRVLHRDRRRRAHPEGARQSHRRDSPLAGPRPCRRSSSADKCVPEAGYKNPYAKAKAFAAYTMAEKVGDLDLLGCFMQKEMDQYIITVCSAHELLRAAARLCDEARELEKSMDTVFRTPHAADGKILSKTTLVSKPE